MPPEMAGTQQLPPWLTLSEVVITNSNGQPIATSTTTLELPLTYYGPSVSFPYTLRPPCPWLSNSVNSWSVGMFRWKLLRSKDGTLMEECNDVVETVTDEYRRYPLEQMGSGPGVVLLLPPTSTSTSSTTTHTTSSTTPLLTSTHVSTFTTTTTSATPYPYTTSSTLSKGAIVGIIFGAIVGFNILLFLIICFVRYRARSLRNRHQTPIWTHWEVVGPTQPSRDEERPSGVGSPRDSGEEADSFLRRSRSAIDGSKHGYSNVRPVASLPPGAAPPRNVGSTGSGDSGNTGSSVATDYGVLLPGGGPIGQAYRDDSHFPARASSDMTGYIMQPGELLKIDDEEEPSSPPRMYRVKHASDQSLPEVFSPLLPPPPIDVDRLSTRKPSSFNEKEKSVRSVSYPASDMEDPKVYTARRVKVRELGPRSPTEESSSEVHHDDSPVPGPSNWRNSFGLGSISRLRKSWFGGSSSRNTSRSSAGRLRADDAEASQSLLGAPRARRPGLGLTIDGDRPMSSVSARSAISGYSVYHDAISRLGTPVSVPSPAITPAGGRGPASANELVPPLPTGAPPAYAVSDPYDSLGSRGSLPYSQGVDVLDIPVPQPVSPFTASGGTSASTRNATSPPGLSGSHGRSWRDSLSVITGSSNNASVTIDVLDAEPPTAREGWRSIAGLGGSSTGEAQPDSGERRATFGTPQIIHQAHPVVSDQGSLHSVRSHLSPFTYSSGSAPMSSTRVLTGSNSSRPSAHSRAPTASSGSVRSGSISSFGRRQGGPVSPSTSAFGGTAGSGRLSPLEEIQLPNPENANRLSVLGPMPSFAHSMISPTIRSVGATTASEDTDVTRTTATLAGTEATLVEKDSHDEFLPKLQLGTFNFEGMEI
ncbi:hypothetical protein JVU11DRAFT_3764 [Chiua virens]|nr:hypothetical protein JVU11DRAFT_3764 [Chiua virens]